jgi:NAD(P)-dependent dehydrogenase (short-subunit alcohol dehydrogenase family)
MTTHDKTAIVTGAGTGIGKAVALALLQDGYRVALAGRRKDPLDAVVVQAGVDGQRALAVPTDVSVPESVALFARTKQASGASICRSSCRRGRAGRQPRGFTYEQWKTVVDINLTGPFLCTQEAIRLMKS